MADDARVGVRSTALLFAGSRNGTRRWLAGFSAAMLAGLCAAGAAAAQHWPYYVALTGTVLVDRSRTFRRRRFAPGTFRPRIHNNFVIFQKL